MHEQKALSLEIVAIISEFLAGSNAFETLASLNVVSKVIHEATLPVLYFAVIWENDDHWRYSNEEIEKGILFVPTGWQYTRILFVDGLTSQNLLEYATEINPDLTYLALFPHLQLLVTKEYGEEPDGWPVPLRSCIVDVYQPVSEHVFATIQEYPLWWPEHEVGCEFLLNDGMLLGCGPVARDNASPESTKSWDNWSSRSESPATMEYIVRRRTLVNPDNAHCTCLRLPFDYIGEIFFLAKGHIIPSQIARPSIRQVHPDIRIFASWNKNDRIPGTLLSLFRLFDFMTLPDIDPLRTGCNVVIRAPCVALGPFVSVLPQILAGNSDLHVVLEFTDQPPFRNSHFTTVMQRIFDSYILALPHLTACRSLKRRQNTLLTIEFPAHRDCRKGQFVLESEITWHKGASLKILTTACRPPRFKKEVIMKHIGRPNCPRILYVIPEEDVMETYRALTPELSY